MVKRKNAIFATIPPFLLCMIATMLLRPYYIAFLATMYMFMILAISWNIISGNTGYISFGNHAFFGLGAYIAAALISYYAFNPYSAAITGGLICIGVSFIFAFPSLKLRGPYFSISTLCLAEALRALFSNLEYFGDGKGFFLSPQYVLYSYYYAILLLLICTIIFSYYLKNSFIGLALASIKGDEDASEACGVDTVFYKIAGFAMSAFFPGIAGGLYVWYMTYIDPITGFSVLFTVMSITMAMFGGMGTFFGPIIGGILFSVLYEILWASFPAFYLIILGASMIIFTIFLPEGFCGILAKKGIKLP